MEAEDAAAGTKIAELQRDLQDVRDRSDFAKLAASQETERYRRECLRLRETVARLTDDYTTVRDREPRDRETIKGLMEEMESKEREFAAKYVELKTEIRDLDRGRQRARDEVEVWKAKCSLLEARLSKLVHETALEFERKGTELKLKFGLLAEQNNGKETAKGKDFGGLEALKLNIAEEKFHLAEKDKAMVKEDALEKSSQKHAGEVDDELPERVKKSSLEDLMFSPKLSRKNRRVVFDSDSDYERSQRHACEVDVELPVRVKSSSKDLMFSPKPSRKIRRVVFDSDSGDEAIDRINDGSQLSKKRLRYAGDTPSMECCVTSVQVADVQTPLRSAKDSEERNRSPGSKKKSRQSDLICSSTARTRGSTTQRRRNSVSNKGAQAHHKRICNNQKSERAYVGRVPSFEQLEQAEKIAEELRSKLRHCNPSFVKTMVRSHVSGGFWLGLPRKFCNQKLPTCELKMILEDEHGVEFGVNYMGHSNALSGGWRGFALDHNLELGDALIFELRELTRFKVYIIKAIPEEESCEDTDNRTANEQILGTNSRGSLDAKYQDVDLSNVG